MSEPSKEPRAHGKNTAPTLVHAIGNGTGGRVQIRTCTLEPYGYVACDHPDEFLEVLKTMLGPNSWIQCDDGRVIQVRHVVQAVVDA